MSWSISKYKTSYQKFIPNGPGIYVVTKVIREHGLILSYEILYVGQSISLRNRWKAHLDNNEPNPMLRDLIRSEGIEFWWRSYPKDRLDEVERSLIRTIQPIANRILYK